MPILPGSINLWAVLSLSPYVSMRRKALHSTLRSHSQHRCLQLLPPRQPFLVAPLCCHLWVARFCCPFSKILRKQLQTFNKQASTHPLRIHWWGLHRKPSLRSTSATASLPVNTSVWLWFAVVHDIWYWLDGDSEALCFICVIWGFAGLMDGTWYSHSPEHSTGCLI